MKDNEMEINNLKWNPANIGLFYGNGTEWCKRVSESEIARGRSKE